VNSKTALWLRVGPIGGQPETGGGGSQLGPNQAKNESGTKP